ncbi:MAG: hypothetical protein JWO13_938 [Acidobacteriales bacterium]|nr:hypothetical protein [Terriglobales bacterium]
MSCENKRWLIIGVVLIAMLLSGCNSVPVTREACLGSYSFVDASGMRTAKLTLNSDGTFVSTFVPAEGVSRIMPKGHWTFHISGEYAQVFLEDSAFPITRSSKQVRILINDDLGQWFEKTD